MKPKELKYPFTWEERRVLIHGRVWYLPACLKEEDSFVFPGFHSPELFGNDHPVFVEYCSGNGAWIAERARLAPEHNFVAVEKRFDRTQKIWSKIHNHQLENLIVVFGEGMAFTKRFLPSDSIEGAFVNFPDPWPKKKHAKHRLIQKSFVDELSRILKNEGVITLVTDDPDYSCAMIESFQHPNFHSLHPEPFYVEDLGQYGSSYFDALWREKGKVIRYHQFENTCT
ncbi:MAG: tRNA (guanine(46)-N(7))-methyltransferase TrmB [Waddliaceae bacterium]